MKHWQTSKHLTKRPPGETRKRRDYRYLQAKRSGQKYWLDATPCREYILELSRYGYTDAAIARKAGVAKSTVSHLRNGEYTRIAAVIADAVMDVRPVPDSGLAYVPAVGVGRRIKALQKIGWRGSDIDEHLGMAKGTSSQLCLRKHVTPATWFKVVEVYDKLSLRRGPSDATSRRVDSPTPLDWETVNIDDPDVWPAKSESSDTDFKRRQAAAWDGPDVTAEDLAKKLGVSSRTIVRWRTERRNSGKEIGGE